LPTEKERDESILGFGIIKRPKVLQGRKIGRRLSETTEEEKQEEHEKREGIIGELLERRKR